MQDLQVVVGLGVTGLSCVRYLKAKGYTVAVTDTRAEPPQLALLQRDFPDVLVSLGALDPILLSQASRIIVSPGLPLSDPLIATQLQHGKPVLGDIELFAQNVQAPVIAITGTNAKSTVTTLVGEMAKAAGYDVRVGGNLGVPILDLLSEEGSPFVLELSSFQLETTYSLKPRVATVLNVTPDHMDRYATFEDYQKAKHRIYEHADIVVCNKDDPLTETTSSQKFYFSVQGTGSRTFGLIKKNGTMYLGYEDRALLPTQALPIIGKHYQANALAALAIGYAYGLSFESMLEVLREFKGLKHRCQFVREKEAVRWYNDSKGTNVGATEAAMMGLGSEISGKLILILGGVGKGADFSALVPLLKQYARHVVLIGETTTLFSHLLADQIDFSCANSMDEAVVLAQHAAQPGDSVLLSPACASFDMFKNFEHRGDVFMQIVERL
ncbi:MAG TPA: UDP-N-acetylmuramoyl-L-alanine--D-glutamate ligase [Gammaproteobacteria bacterium]|jgi:UDP-N-acetylmuramoylalanine--D-glutamate ligase|nr:UDP-N-acetylmuramoyl-L-alanine--D-glutamate ligase [Gammaproteobacteria bacterium]